MKSTEFLGSEGVYMLPHHAKEIDRLTKQHNFMETSTGHLLLAPTITEGSGPLRVLDAGCADGTWLRSLKSQFPSRQLSLFGVDIGSSLFPSPEAQGKTGIDLREHNITKPFPASWGWSNTFDAIHQRLLVWGLKSDDWASVVKNYFDILKPGGWLQLVEIEFISRDNPHPDSRPLLQKQAAMQRWSTASFGMDIDIAYNLRDYMRDAGLVDIKTIQFDHGYGALARDQEQKDPSAELWVECFRTLDDKMGAEGIPGVAKDAKEFHQFLDQLEIDIKALGYQPKLNFVYARKPLGTAL